MGYGKKGWFKTYIKMMNNSFKYAANSVSKHDHWLARGFSLLFAIIWYIVTLAIFIGVPIAIIIFIVLLFFLQLIKLYLLFLLIHL